MKSLSCVRLFVTPWIVAYQAPPSMGFSRQEYWSGVPFPSPGDLPDPGIEPGSPALEADALPKSRHKQLLIREVRGCRSKGKVVTYPYQQFSDKRIPVFPKGYTHNLTDTFEFFFENKDSKPTPLGGGLRLHAERKHKNLDWLEPQSR